MKNSIQAVTNAIFGFFLTVVLTLSLITATLASTVLNRNFIVTQFSSASFCQGVMDSVIDNALNLGIPSQIGEEELTGVFEYEKVQNDITMYMVKSFEGITYAVDTSAMAQKLTENINKAIVGDGVELTPEINKQVGVFVSQVMADYTSAVSFSFVSYLVKAVSLFNKILLPLCVGLVVAILVLVGLIVVFNKYMHRSLRQINYSIMAAALTGLIASMFCIISGIYTRVQLSPEYFYNMFVKYISTGLIVLLVLSIALILTDVVIWVFTWKLRRNASVK